MKIILVRHGETTWNKESRLQGCTDIPLAPAGYEQLRLTGEYLAKAGIPIDRILSSPLQRARKSAEIIAEKINYPAENILAAPLFIERGFGECEGMVYSDALTKYPDGNYPGMETFEELFERAEKAIHQCEDAYPDQTILVTAHGAIIKAILVVLTHGQIGYFDKDVWIENGSCCLLDGNTDNWTISIYSPLNQFKQQLLR